MSGQVTGVAARIYFKEEKLAVLRASLETIMTGDMEWHMWGCSFTRDLKSVGSADVTMWREQMSGTMGHWTHGPGRGIG